MLLTDFHMHSNCSSDGKDTMQDMASACLKRGVRCVCFTDHCDLDDYRTGLPDAKSEQLWRRSLDAYRQTLAAAPAGLDLRFGVELGELNHDPHRARGIIASVPELDFVLGSVHNLKNTLDFYCLRYESDEHCARLLESYLQELTEVAAMDCFDILSHIGYTTRYMRQAGYYAAIEDARYDEQVRLLLKTLIENGKGLEVNTSGLRRATINSTIPGEKLLRLYRELGGELLTVGSDAHCTADAGAGIPEALALLRELGYRHVCTYQARQPAFHPL